MSFRLKTILGIAAIEVVLLAILILSGLHYLRSSNEAQLLNRAGEASRLFATMVSDAVVSMDFATLDALVQQTLRNRGIVYVRVRHANGSIMAEGGAASALAEPFRQDPTVAAAADDNRLDVVEPIVTAGQRFGQVEMGFSTADIAALVDAAVGWMASIAIAEIVLVAVAGLLLGTILTRQLERLRRGAERVAAGEFGHQIRAAGRDELAATSRAFNSMSESLAKYAAEAQAARQRAETRRDHAEAALRDALESMPQGVVIVGRGQEVAFANSAYRNMYPALVRESPEGRPFAWLAGIIACYRAASEAEGRLNPAFERVVRLQDPVRFGQWQSSFRDGRVVMTTQRRMSDGGVVIVETDLSNLYQALDRNRRLEMEILQNQKMESLGTLAGGIAHEINTPIQYVADNLDFLKESFAAVQAVLTETIAADSDRCELSARLGAVDWDYIRQEIPNALAEAEAGVTQVAKIVQSVKAFCHPQSEAMIETDLPDLVETVLTVSRNQWKYAAEVVCDFSEGAETVSCHPGELSQVLINLIVNAAHAIEERPDGGRGTITIASALRGRDVEISVRDDGCGIPKDAIGRIFDLFYTTKPPGKGTGQGLALCRSMIVDKHGGRILVDSEVGVGTVFRVLLPRNGAVQARRALATA